MSPLNSPATLLQPDRRAAVGGPPGLDEAAAGDGASERALSRRSDHERFVGFAFASAELLVETDESGVIAFAAGAFRSHFGRGPDAYFGVPARELVSAIDQEAFDSALWLLRQRGRLAPLLLRLANKQRTSLALAGLALSGHCHEPGRRICLSFALPPAATARAPRSTSLREFAQAAESRRHAQTPFDLSLLEVVDGCGVVVQANETFGQALLDAIPGALTQEIAPGRYGLLDASRNQAQLASLMEQLDTALRAQGLRVAVAGRRLKLTDDELTPAQAARAIRQALAVFARGGSDGLNAAGFELGLAGYLQQAGSHTRKLRQLIQDVDFKLSFQPIVQLSSRETHHYEALIRLKPTPGIPDVPQEFVTLIEALGLAEELDLAVARLAARVAHASGRVVAFNLSGQSMQSSVFRATLVDQLRKTPAYRAGLLMVEMTETAEIEDLDEAARTAEALRSINVPFCLDDFGAGSADLRLLRALCPSFVKLDGSYVAGVTASGRERALVAGMAEIARGAGAGIIAERIETEAEADILRQFGVQYGQGWLYGRPGPIA